MPHSQILETLKKERFAAKRFEKSGHHKFRDCITFCKNGKIYFERYNYGEAAGLVFSMWAIGMDESSAINWDYASSSYSKKTEAPQHISDFKDGKLFFDSKQQQWECARNFKFFPKAGFFMF